MPGSGEKSTDEFITLKWKFPKKKGKWENLSPLAGTQKRKGQLSHVWEKKKKRKKGHLYFSLPSEK